MGIELVEMFGAATQGYDGGIITVLRATVPLASSSSIRRPLRRYRYQRCRGAWTLINGQELVLMIGLPQIPGCSMLGKRMSSKTPSYLVMLLYVASPNSGRSQFGKQ